MTFAPTRPVFRAPPHRFTGFPGGFEPFSILSVSDEDMIAFSAQVDQLNGDIAASADKIPPFTVEEPSQNQMKFAIWYASRWNPWYGQWLVWREQHQTGASRLPSSAGIEFGQWRSEWNVLLDSFKRFGGSTSLEPSDTTVPPPTVEPPEDEDDDPWYVEITDVVSKNLMITTLLAGAGLLAYAHFTSRR